MARRDDEDHDLRQDDRSERPPLALIVGGIVAALAVVFVFQNTGDTTVNFLWIDFDSTLWFVIVLSIALGIIIDRLFAIWRRRSHRSDD